MSLTDSEQYLLRQLRDAPRQHEYRYTAASRALLLRDLFLALTNNNPEYIKLLFPGGLPTDINPESWVLSTAQGAVEGAEYSAAARGKPCGHIFKAGEATYRCKTCSLDDTCVLCSKCYAASDHEGHAVTVYVSGGNCGCCDCGDPEAWQREVKCAIHTAYTTGEGDGDMDVDRGSSPLPEEFVNSIRTTIGRALDYICDVISCAPEQLRIPKTEETVREDEEGARLVADYYGAEEGADNMEYCVVLWNDEKHTVDEVEYQVARACKKMKSYGKARAEETDFIGRSIIKYSSDLPDLLKVARIVEQIRVTTTVRSARDTYREQMCGTIIEWLEDISGCSAGDDHDILRRTVCEELLGVWRMGSKASNIQIGKEGIDDHSAEEEIEFLTPRRIVPVPVTTITMDVDAGGDTEDEQQEEEDPEGEDLDGEDDAHDSNDGEDGDDDDVDMVGGDGGGTEPNEEGNGIVFRAGTYTIEELLRAAEQHPEPVQQDPNPETRRIPHDRGNEEEGLLPIPKTPLVPKDTDQNANSAPDYWVQKPSGYHRTEGVPLYENLKKRVRLDWLIMFDLRLWKKARTNLRDLYISTVVAIPEFKRILGLRFAGLYTTLSELYLVADREPDHSIINLSLQMLTTPTITAEVVHKGNFLTNLMAILYTFLTKRQVSRPEGVDPKAVLAFDGPGTNPLTNRRMFHFFHDLKYLLVSTYVQKMIRDETRYTQQFLDLVKLHQGICPNVRAITEHVEFETDTWLSAAMVTREMNKFARLFAEAFVLPDHKFDDSLRRAISYAADYATVSSMGWEQHRAVQTETRSVTTFKRGGGYMLDSDMWGEPNTYKVVRFSVDKDPISFHHALHYTLSWMVEAGKAMSAEELRHHIMQDMENLAHHYSPTVPYDVDDLALAMFDIPLRVCVWLGQQKTNMWVRNGFSLRHQMQSYRGVMHREMTHQRDIFLIQTALVTLNPSRFLANMIDRFNLHGWMTGDYSPPEGYESGHIVDMAEEFLHLLIILLSERLTLIPYDEEQNLPILRIRREIIHVLCFKPLQFSELSRMLTDRIQEHPEFQNVLRELTNFRPPDGLSDYGTFELKPEYLDEVDPYILQFSKNQREETEAAYRARLAKKTGQKEDDVTYVPQLRPIKTGAFAGLAAFTMTPLFSHVIYYSLLYALQHAETATGVSNTRTEIYLQLCLHLCQLAVIEDKCDEQHPEQNSFVTHALQKHGPGGPSIDGSSEADTRNTVATLLAHIFKRESSKASRPKVLHVLRSIRQKHPTLFDSNSFLATALGENATADDVDAEKLAAERKKQLAKERQARIMAQMKAQQQSFIDTSGMDFEDDEFSDTDEAQEEQHTQWKYPTGTCILCQEEMNDSKLFGTLAFVAESKILRETAVKDTDYLYEVATTPESLDRDAKDIRPFGVASLNKVEYKKLTADGSEVTVQRQTLGRGFPPGHSRAGPAIVGCTHLMHYGCFEQYCESTRRRQPSQIARNHPENIEKKEFVCPLCKALGNTFLPIIWKSKKEAPASAIVPEQEFAQWLQHLGLSLARVRSVYGPGSHSNEGSVSECLGMFKEYAIQNIVPGISDNMSSRRLTPSAPLLPMQVSSWGTAANILQHPRPTVAHMFQQSQSFISMAGSSSPSPPPVQYDELYAAYQRLKETYRVNKIPANYTSPPELFNDKIDLDVAGYETLAMTLGFSISGVEIAQRGVASDIGATLLDRVSPQTLTLLRIYSETVSSYIAVSILRSQNREGMVLKLKERERQYMQRLFLGNDSFMDDEARRTFTEDSEPLLSQDMFVFCTEFVVCALPSMGWDPMHVIRLCYIAELVKSVVVVEQDGDLSNNLQQWENAERLGYLEARIAYTEQQLDLFQRFAKLVGRFMGLPESFSDLSSFSVAVFRQLVRAYATPFLRKTVILMHARFGVLFPPCDFAESDRPEEERLARMLKLPALDEIFETILSDTTEGQHLRTLMQAWCDHARYHKTKLRISHPAIFELVGLPRDYDVLIEEATKRRCPTTGKDITDPNICLFCGAIFCGQSVCCRNEERQGGCNRHLQQCGGNVGIFISVRRCSLLFLHSDNGSFVETPYMDAHGETDHGLRRNRQLYLNQKRYDALVRNVWLNHGIPTLISRKLEAELNTGGWDTL